MYLLFKSVDSRLTNIIKPIGTFMSYTIGYIPETHTDIVEYRHLNPIIISEDVAKAWKFIGCARGKIGVRQNTPQNDDLQIITSEEPLGTKVYYVLTDEDKKNTVELQKAILQLMLDEIFDKRMISLNLSVSQLEMSSWEQQKTEAFNYPDKEPVLLTALANSRGITINEMVEKVKNSVNVYNSNLSNLLSTKQSIETEIKNCSTIADCNRLGHLKFEIEMPSYQKEDENITTSASFNI